MPTPETDYYVLLGIDPGADSVTIRKAVVGQQRRWGARQNAPDLATRQEAERFGQLLTDVRDVLLDPGQRALYDIQRVEALPDLALLFPRPPVTAPRHIIAGWSGRIAGVGVALVVALFLTTRASTGTPTFSASAARVPAAAVVPPVPLALVTSAPTPAPLASEAATPEPGPAAAARAQVFVADTDGEGVYLSSTPNRGDRLTAWPEGSLLEVVGDDVTGDGLLWAAVRTSDGQVGFMPRQYVSATPPRRVLPTPPPATRPPDEVPVTRSGTPLSTSIILPPDPPFALAGGRYSISWSVAGHQPCDFVITIADSVTPALVRTTLSNHVLNRADGQPAQGQTSVNLTSGKYRLEAYSDTCTWNLTLYAG